MEVDARLFNPVYWHIKQAMDNPDIRFIYVMGGSSASKTYSIVQNIIFDTYESHNSTLVLRKHSTEIDDSVYRDFKTIIKPIEPPIFKALSKNIKLGNDCNIRFKGMDYSEKVKGISDFQRVYLNEISSFNHTDYKEIRRRLRGREGQQIIADWNPISKNHWMKKKVIDKETWIDQPKSIEGIKYSELHEDSYVKINETGNAILIKTTYKDNYWIVGHPVHEDIGRVDHHTLQEFKDMERDSPDDFTVYGLGEWGTISSRLIFTNWKEIDGIPLGCKRLPSGLDFGFSPDPTTLIDVYTKNTENGKIIILDERIFETGLTNVKTGNPLEKTIQGSLEKLGFNGNDIIICDTENKSVRELRNAGFNAWEARKGPGSIMQGIKLMKSYFICITKNSVNLIREFEEYKRKIDKHGTILPEPIDDDNHGIDAVRYVFLMKNKLWS
jgi:PBSX family phage terminase large subunit